MQRLKKILEEYPNDLPRFRFPWGTTPDSYYNWVTRDRPQVNGYVVYVLAPGSRWLCLDGSFRIEDDGALVSNGTYHYEEEMVKNFPKQIVYMNDGGV